MAWHVGIDGCPTRKPQSLVCLKRKLWREDAHQGVDATVCGDERGGQGNPSAQCRRHTDGPPPAHRSLGSL